MDWWLISFFLGAILSLFLPIVPAFSYVILFTCLSIGLFYFQRTRKVVGFALGLLWIIVPASIYNHTLTINKLELSALYQQKILVQGKVASLITTPNKANNPVRFNFLIEQLDNKKLAMPFKVRLSWLNPSQKLAQQQQWQLFVKLKPAHGLANSGGFHYQTWLRKNDLVASGYVVSNKAYRKVAENKLLSLHQSSSLRQRWFDHLEPFLRDKEYGAIFLALTFGVRDQLTKNDWQTLQATGTQHLLAISGLHIGLIAGAGYWLVIGLLRLLPFYLLPKKIQSQCLLSNVMIFAMLFSIFTAIFYSYLAGFAAPTCRALTMLSLFYLTKLLAITLSKVRLLLLTVFWVLVFQPMSILGVGFWLSFYAVSIIFYLHWLFQYYLERGKPWRNFLLSLLIIQLGLSVFILPIAAYLQYQIPLAALLANLVAVPLLSFLCLPLVLLSFFCFIFFDGVTWLNELTFISLDILWQWLSVFSHFSWLQISVNYFSLSLSIIVILLFVTVFTKSHNRYAYSFCAIFTLILVLCLGSYSLKSTKEKQWQVHVFDVGQGLSVLIQKNQRAVLYDTGASYLSGFSMAEAVIFPYLQQQGIKQLDTVIISHSDNDHAGSLVWLKEKVKIKTLFANDLKLQPDQPCIADTSFHWQGLTFEVLAPQQINSGKNNDDSCVIKVSDNHHFVLLTGDISKKVEQQLVQQHPEQLSADILIAPHHGSNTSSSEVFINSVAPEYVVFSAGFMNRWGMPRNKVLEKYVKYQVTPLKTADSGMISFVFTESSFDVIAYKKQRYAFWFAN